MLSQSRAVAILPGKDLNKSKEFYTNTLGLKLEGEFPGVVMFSAGEGSRVVVYEKPDGTKAEHTVLGFDVEDLAMEMAALRDKGVAFEEYDLPNLKTVEGVADFGPVKSAWFKDPDGNIIALNQM